MVHAKLDEELVNVVSLLVGAISILNQRVFAGPVPMFGLAVCSLQFSVHPVAPGHIIEIHTRIKDALMFGDRRNLVRLNWQPTIQAFTLRGSKLSLNCLFAGRNNN